MNAEAHHKRLDLRAYARILWRRKWLLVLCLLTLPVAAYFLSARNPKTYQSSVLLQVQAPVIDTSLFSTGTDQAVPDEQTIAAAAKLIHTSGVAQAAARLLHPPPANYRTLLDQVSVAPDDQTARFVTITATASKPQRAADVATAFANAAVTNRINSAKGSLDAAIGRITRQIPRLAPSDTNGRRQLSQQLQRFRALRAAQGANAQIVEPAVASSVPISPHPRRAAALGLVLALLLGTALMAAAEAADRRIRSTGEAEELTGLPLLSSIPRSVFGDVALESIDQEPFQALRTSLTYFNVDRTISSVLITSAGAGEGKTTVAVNLARSMAKAGKRVIVVDADLRAPQVAKQFGISNDRGLGAVLSGLARLDEVAIRIDEDPTVAFAPYVVPAGPPPPNPSELIGSERMQRLLNEMTERCDTVIIDTSPVTTVSDAIPLLEQVSGVVVLARINQTRRDALVRLQQVIDSAKGSILGIVATGESKHSPYYYTSYHPASPASQPNGDGGDGNGVVAGRRRRGLRRTARR